jgi:hypothetical protein
VKHSSVIKVVVIKMLFKKGKAVSSLNEEGTYGEWW